jgi:hypothetical protein
VLREPGSLQKEQWSVSFRFGALNAIVAWVLVSKVVEAA